MAQISRQLLASLVRGFARRAIAEEDQKYGRQLATILELTALALRAHLGGKPAWELGKSAKKPAHNPANGTADETVEIRVLSPAETWERELTLWREIAALEKPLGVLSDYEWGLRIEALGRSAGDFVWPILDARREHRPLVVTSPDGEPITIDNL